MADADRRPAAITEVTKTFVDPESTRFRNLIEPKQKSDSDYVLCGELNSKNAFGGYTGYTKFILIDAPPTAPQVFFRDIAGRERLKDQFDQMYEKACASR